MTNQELKDLVASLAVQSRETAEQMKESREKADLERKEFREEMKRLREDTKELSKDTKELSRRLGGIDDNIGYHAETFFQDIFKKKLEFGRVKYDEIFLNLSHNSKKGQIEFDIALINGDCVAIIEVKHRIHPNFVRELAEHRVGMFRKLFPEFESYSAYLGIAGFSLCDEVLEQASKYGIGIIKQVGKGVEIEASNLKAY